MRAYLCLGDNSGAKALLSSKLPFGDKQSLDYICCLNGRFWVLGLKSAFILMFSLSIWLLWNSLNIETGGLLLSMTFCCKNRCTSFFCTSLFEDSLDEKWMLLLCIKLFNIIWRCETESWLVDDKLENLIRPGLLLICVWGEFGGSDYRKDSFKEFLSLMLLMFFTASLV